jgi:hypothetical protein
MYELTVNRTRVGSTMYFAGSEVSRPTRAR